MKPPLAALSAFLLFAAPSFAADESFFLTSEAVSASSGTSVISVGYIIQLLFSLLVVVGLAYFAAKFVLPRLKYSTRGTYINVIDKVVIEPQVTAYILKAGNESWLIGVSNRNIVKIDKLEGNLQ